MKTLTKNRYLEPHIMNDLADKMVFIGGPRQVGKTTMSQKIAESISPNYQYLNWDSQLSRKIILNEEFNPDSNLLVFDEIHKYRTWKRLIKGVYDTLGKQINIIVTGSSRLDVYRRGGDSLQGRYHYYRLHPFSLSEVLSFNTVPTPLKEFEFQGKTKLMKDAYKDLEVFGGYPEPFFLSSTKVLRRWQNERVDRLVREDIRDVESLRDLTKIQILADILPAKVGSLFSLNALREDLEVTHKTISSWVDILEKFYYIFRIYPFQSTLIKSLKKEPKLFLWDWSPLEDEGSRNENIVASHLLKFVHFLKDTEGYKTDLFYIRDKESRELDFLVTFNSKPWFAVEVKGQITEVSKNCIYFKEKLKIPFVYQLTSKDDVDFKKSGVRVMTTSHFLSALV